MMFDAVPADPFQHGECRIKLADGEWELRQAQSLRKRVFVEEQQVFRISDFDHLDHDAYTLIATTSMLGIPDSVVGTVRINQTAKGKWQGSRLAVDAMYRHSSGIGKDLIKMAVGTALTLGCESFYANVQLQNQAFFERLGWCVLGHVLVEGLDHVFMQANLNLYSPAPDPNHGCFHLFSKALPPEKSRNKA